MQIVAGLTLKHLEPRVWDLDSPYYLPELNAVMISYADVVTSPAWQRRFVSDGMHSALRVPPHVRIFLDNGAFAIAKRGGAFAEEEYAAFVKAARPDWFPIPRDEIPSPQMPSEQQRLCFQSTMRVNRRFAGVDAETLMCEPSSFVPVVHIGDLLPNYLRAIRRHEGLRDAPALAVGGIVPNLLRSPKAKPPAEILESMRLVRRTFPEKRLHIFGVGGTATVHLAALLGFDSADSSGWRNRAARGIVQLSGTGDRIVADLGKWRGRVPSEGEWDRLRNCLCPACQRNGLDGLRANGSNGFSHRATHNLWILLEETAWVRARLNDGTYADTFRERLDNTMYLPLLEAALQIRLRGGKKRRAARVR